jgi:hypothetical protein
LYVPDGRPLSVALAPDPPVITFPGKRVSVHEFTVGRPFSTTLPVDKIHVGAVIVPITGVDGITGCADIATLPEAGEVHPSVLVTVKV